MRRVASKKMTTVHYFHNVVGMSKHIAPSGFPERPTRLSGIETAMEDLLPRCVSHLQTEPVVRDVLVREYGAAEVKRWETAAETAGDYVEMDDRSGDVYWSRGSMEAVRLAAGAAVAAVGTALDAAAAGRTEHAFAAVRPPGHHCFDAPAGFCIANNVVLAARAALDRGKRVAIVDWDYHFGDGTAQALLSTPEVTFCSLHCEYDRRGSPTYPYSPKREARILKGGELARATRGRMFNIMWGRDDADNAAYITAFTRVVVPAFRKFAPDIVLVSAGYDALRGDALAGMELTPSVFYELAAELKTLGVPIVCVLEGGYDPGLLGAGVRATVDGLLAPRGEEACVGAGDPARQHMQVINAVEESLKSFGAI
jgi:acetoin utilization deacetylase AcuC-like enzyme